MTPDEVEELFNNIDATQGQIMMEEYENNGQMSDAPFLTPEQEESIAKAYAAARSLVDQDPGSAHVVGQGFANSVREILNNGTQPSIDEMVKAEMGEVDDLTGKSKEELITIVENLRTHTTGMTARMKRGEDSYKRLKAHDKRQADIVTDLKTKVRTLSDKKKELQGRFNAEETARKEIQAKYDQFVVMAGFTPAFVATGQITHEEIVESLQEIYD